MADLDFELPDCTPVREGPLEEVCGLPGVATLYRRENGVGGHLYMSDSVDGGVVVWDTSLVSRTEILIAVAAEERREATERLVARDVRGPSGSSHVPPALLRFVEGQEGVARGYLAPGADDETRARADGMLEVCRDLRRMLCLPLQDGAA